MTRGRRCLGLGLGGPIAALSFACLAPAASAEPAFPAALADTLSFEFADSSGAPAGWYPFNPPLRRDTRIVHGGRASGRIDRNATTGGSFSGFARSMAADVAGDTLELRGWIRTDAVTEFAGIWLREDGPSGTLQFDNMQNRALAGTTGWTEYRVALPLDRAAAGIVYGGLLAGTGTAWFDDVRLLVDGRPVTQAPRRIREVPAAERDHEFDSGSRLSERDLTGASAENLALLGRVWGFVKYRHPRIASGGLNWDYELFRALPDVAKARTLESARRAIVKWIDRIGLPAACRPCAALPESLALEPPIEWIHDRARLGGDLASRLERIDRDRSTAYVSYYLGRTPVRTAVLNENAYAGREYPDAGYRLLALFRFWNVVEYLFPYRDLLRDWDAVLPEFVPRVLADKNSDDYRLTMIDLAVRVHDSHCNVWNSIAARPPVGGCRLPIAARAVGDRFVVGAYADSARAVSGGFRIGDVIVALDGAPVDSLARVWTPHYNGSNEAALRRNIAGSLTQGPCGPCQVEIDRGGGRRTLAAARDSIRTMDARAGSTHDRPGPTFRMLADDIAYLKLSTVSAADVDSYLTRAAGTRCFVIDIRNYPKQSVIDALGSHLVEHRTPFVRFTRYDPVNPGAFAWSDSAFLDPKPPRYSGKVVILVDEVSQSHAEFTAMALRTAPGALVVGSTTAGADGNVVPVPLPGGLRAMITGLGVFYPDNRPTQQVGIVPDLVVRPTAEGIRAGRDEVLEAALEAALGRNVQVPTAQ